MYRWAFVSDRERQYTLIAKNSYDFWEPSDDIRIFGAFNHYMMAGDLRIATDSNPDWKEIVETYEELDLDEFEHLIP